MREEKASLCPPNARLTCWPHWEKVEQCMHIDKAAIHWKIQSGASGFRKSEPGRRGQEARGWGALIPPLLFPPEDPQADSSASPLPHLEAKIQQTHSLARLLTKYAEQLLQEYVSGIGGCEYQGPGKWGSID